MSSARIVAAALLLAPFAGRASAQTLDRRVSGAADGSLQFHFAAREGVCGDGRGTIRSDDGSYIVNSGTDGGCQRGPVRVVVVRAGKEIVRIDSYAGPLRSDAEVPTDLGTVGAKEAATWLLGLASTLEGRPARDVIFPATLADSTAVTPVLLQLAQDAGRSRDLRRSAIASLARRRNESGGAGADAVMRALDKIAHDQQESEALRQSALSAISGFDHAEGIPVLIRYADEGDGWLGRQSFASLARSGDPRARRYTRDALRRPGLSEENRVQAIQGLGGEYSTSADLRLLRDAYAGLDTDRQRDAVISVLSSAGGRENVDWLLALAKSPTESVARRRRVVSLLGRSEDPRIQAALKEMVEKH